MSTPDPKQMREDASAWARAGYPGVAVGRYRDAAAEIERLRRLHASWERLILAGTQRPSVFRLNDLITHTARLTLLGFKDELIGTMQVVEASMSEQPDMIVHTSLSQGGSAHLLPGPRSVELSLVLRSVG